MAPVKKSPTRGSVRQSTRGAGAITAHRLPPLDAADWSGTRGSLDGTGLKIAIACSRFNGNVTDLLLNGALAELDGHGVKKADRTVVWVPGAFELPLAASVAARSGQYDAVICLGAIIRGETSHYELIAGECASGIQRLQLELTLPVVFGVLTTEDLAQALARAGGAHGNKGAEAAATAIETVNVLRELERTRPGLFEDAPAGRKTR